MVQAKSMSCDVCESGSVERFLSLGAQPPSDAFLTSDAMQRPQPSFPLDLEYCSECHLVQLGYAVDPHVLFSKDYVYNSGSSAELKRNFAQVATQLSNTWELGAGDLVVDIGSNDGTLLAAFAAHGAKVLGIEPTDMALRARDAQIPTEQVFFSSREAKRIVAKHGAAKIVTATNVFAHVVDLHDFVQGVNTLLDAKGVFVTESHHLLSMVRGMQWDAIYHEHLRYYSLQPLLALFDRHGMEVIDAGLIPTHGGSIRVTAARAGVYAPNRRALDDVVAKEARAGLYNLALLVDFADRVNKLRGDVRAAVVERLAAGNRIVGIGAPAKGNTLLNGCSLPIGAIQYLAETSDVKVGLFAPGTHIPVVHESQMFEEPPDVGLLLSWNLRDFIVPKLRAKGFTGEVLVPCPHVQSC